MRSFTKSASRAICKTICTAIFSFGVVNFCEGQPTLDRSLEDFDQNLGFDLETNFWNTVKKHERTALSKKISRIFGGVSPSGIYFRRDQIHGLLKGRIRTYSLENFQSKRQDDVIINTYNFEYTGTGLVEGPVVSVWKKFGKHWKMVSESYKHNP